MSSFNESQVWEVSEEVIDIIEPRGGSTIIEVSQFQNCFKKIQNFALD
jgi:hypothetical protein